MTRKRSSQRLELEDQVLEHVSDEKLDMNDYEEDSSEGDDVAKLYQCVKSFDKTLSTTLNATKSDSKKQEGSGGSIQEIEMFNFMCHEHLKVELKENINFIVGNNGSGKSAILTALTVCLGARASTTQRASSLDSLIKEGAAEARVIVKISNVGVLRFKGDIYGDSIVIERRFRRVGPNTFKVKSGETGRIVSERKDEVISICDNYNIQVDNPLLFLTQETAKKFLVNSTPQDLYTFFLRGTQLEQLTFDYIYAFERMKSIEKSLESAKANWPSFESDIDSLKNKLKMISESKEITEMVRKLKAEIAWTEINNLEKEEADKEEALSTERAVIESNNENVVVLNEKLKETNETLKGIDTELTELYHSKKPLNEELKTTEKKVSKVNNDLNENETVLKDINTAVTKAKVDMAEIESKIEESMRDVDADRIEKKNELERLEQEIQVRNRQLRENEQQLRLNTAEIESMETSLDKANADRSTEKRNGEEMAKKLDVAKSAADDKMKFFGENIPEVFRIIRRRENEFMYKPIGPIGMHVELKDKSWSKPMDAIIGNQLKSFITHDHSDRILLESILKSCKCNNPVINLSRDPIDYSSGEPDRKYLTALRALNIDNEMVEKALVMFSSIERILLISDRIEAREVMMARLRNVDAAYTHTHRITATQNSLAFFVIYPNSKGNPFESSEERVKSLSIQIRENAHRLNIITRDIERLRRSIDGNREIETQLKEQQAELKKQVSVFRSEVRTLDSALKSTDETGTEVLKSEQESLLNQLTSLKSQFGDNFECQMRLKEEIDELNIHINSIKEDLLAKDNEIERKKELLSSLGNERREIQAKIDNLKTTSQQLIKLLDVRTAALENIKKRIAEAFSKVPTGFYRVFANRPITVVEKEITDLEKRIEQGQEYDPEDFEYVKTDLEEKTIEYEKSKTNVQTNRIILDDMKIALACRDLNWKELRHGIVDRSIQDFSTCLQARDYRGYLEYNHKECTLNINVHIDQMEQNTSKSVNLSKRDIKQLSGGEKSFGTMCFLLSLWDAMAGPIKCLDEFDVYMDAVNRRLVVEMLINNVKSKNSQFILITPVSVRTFLDRADEDKVHMIVLSDPRRS